MPELQTESKTRLPLSRTEEAEDPGASDDSGSLTQRATIIRDELLGNDLLDQDTERASGSSSRTDADEGDTSSHKGLKGDEDDLEERLSTSSISHSLRHIALAFDEKVCRLIQRSHTSIDFFADPRTPFVFIDDDARVANLKVSEE